MNHLFKQALEEAGATESGDGLYNTDTMREDFLERFATQIIKGCIADLLLDRVSNPTELWMDNRNYGIDFCIDAIKTTYELK